MHRYRAYELTIDSELELPGLPPGPSPAPADVVVSLGRLDRDELVSAPDGSRIGAFFHDLARFLIEDGRRVRVDVRRDVDPEVISSRLVGEIFAALLRQRGHLVLHACAVAREGRATAFVGESGWGKSTLAEAFCQRGYSLVTDDVMAVTFRGETPVLVASYPQIRLRLDSAEYLVPGGEGLEPIERNGPKLAREGASFSESEAVLSKLYFLEPTFRQATSVERLAPTEALLRLIEHTRARTLIQTNTPKLLADHLDLCGRLVRAAPPAVLRRRGSFDALPEAVSAVEHDAGGADAPARPA